MTGGTVTRTTSTVDKSDVAVYKFNDDSEHHWRCTHAGSLNYHSILQAVLSLHVYHDC